MTTSASNHHSHIRFQASLLLLAGFIALMSVASSAAAQNVNQMINLFG
jgi:hypothetical protein